jgi:nucleoside transporter
MNAVRFKLSVMMFLQFFIWGAWFELGFDYIPTLGFDPDWQLPLIFGAFNLGALVALFFSTQFADRKFAAEKFLAFSHLVGGLAITGLFFVRKEGDAAPFWPFFGLMLVHCLLYVPTISITNSIAFANLRDATHDFGRVRVWGTIGWIVASWPFIFILVDWARVPDLASVGPVDWLGKALGTSKEGAEASSAQRYIFLVAGIASLLLAAFSLALPHTPPRPAAAGESLAWLKAAKLLRHPFVLVLFIVTFIDAAVHQSYFYWTASFLSDRVGIPKNWVPPVMKISQIAEILTMLALGYVLKNLGWRATMVFGVLGHAARFAVFAYLPEQVPAILINVVHGVCYAFFFATVYIFVDEFFPKDVRSSAQGLFNALILGVGPFVANFLCGRLKTRYTIDGTLDYPAVFQYSIGAAVVGAVLLAVFFHPRKPAVPHEEPAPVVAP